MRTSRLSRETAALLSALDPSLPAKRPRRGPQSLLSTSSVPPLPTPPASTGLDIEDAAASFVSTTSVSTTASSKKRKRRAPAKRVVGSASPPLTKDEDDDVEGKATAPPGWEALYRACQELRATVTAPVDTMGCESLHQKSMPAAQQRFQTLVALMLSSQTKDTTNAVVMRRLQTELPQPRGLCIENILAVSDERLNELIWAVGFHNRKTVFIKAAAAICRDEYDGDIPDTIEGLIALPGVGPKMGYLCLSAAWGKTEGIGVDVHVHRITNLWGWHKTNTPEETRLALQSWLPRERWHEINHLLVGLGQTVCLPVGRRCGECRLGVEGLCKTGRPRGFAKGKREVVKTEEVVETKVKEEIAV